MKSKPVKRAEIKSYCQLPPSCLSLLLSIPQSTTNAIVLFCLVFPPRNLPTCKLKNKTKEIKKDDEDNDESNDHREPERNAVPIDRQSTSHDETDYEDEEYYDDELPEDDSFIPSDFTSNFFPPAASPSSTTTTATTTTTKTTTTTSPSTTVTTSPPTPKTKATVTMIRSRGPPTPPPRKPFIPAAAPTRTTTTTTKVPSTTSSRKPDVALNDPNAPVYLSPQDNEIADSSNVKNNVPPNVNEPNNKIESDSQDGMSSSPRLNLGNLLVHSPCFLVVVLHVKHAIL